MDGQLLGALILWTVLLAAVLFVVVPVVVYRAWRLVRAARSIRTHFARTLEAAAGIVGNTQPASAALAQTIDVAGGILQTAGQIDGHTAAIEQLVSARAGIEGAA